MKVLLISTYMYPVALGMRYISAFCKQAGHEVVCLHLSSRRDTMIELTASLKEDIIDHCRDADVVGISLMTNSFYRSCELTELLREADIKAPIVWGGTHPTVAPEESAEVADYVCVGEGEKGFVEFLEVLGSGGDPGSVRGFAYKRDGKLVRNKPYPLSDDLDSYPFPDYELNGHWAVEDDHLVPAQVDLLRGVLRRYRMSSTRGCPYSCTFCNNATQMQIYKDAGYGDLWVRKRSTESIIGELEHIRSMFPSVEEINLIDDLFLVREEEELEKFVQAYRARVNRPLEVDVFPNLVDESKTRILAKLPISLVSMGIQSGSQETLFKLYHRPTKLDKIANAIRTISSHGLPAEYHYLVSNPFESDENRLETLRFAANHHRGPARLRIFPLQFYPGSVMYRQAREAGIIGERHDHAYEGLYHTKRYFAEANYLEIWLPAVLRLRGKGVPVWMANKVVGFAAHPLVRRVLDKPWFAPFSFYLYRTGHLLYKNLIRKPIIKPIQSLAGRKKKKRARRHRTPTTGVTQLESAQENNYSKIAG
jgi:anaerobic magnesium-protoporphyrin IX monomethyl ester cyclase